jgi:hypothetical protein
LFALPPASDAEVSLELGSAIRALPALDNDQGGCLAFRDPAVRFFTSGAAFCFLGGGHHVGSFDTGTL